MSVSDRLSLHRSDTFRKRATAAALAVSVFLALFFGSDSAAEGFVGALIVLGLSELSIYFRGVHTLYISPRGINVERWRGKKIVRVAWLELASVEFTSSGIRGPMWTFHTKAGSRIQWYQDGLKGDRRQSLADALLHELREHRIRVN